MEIRITRISKKLKNLREERNFTQEELAKALGVSRQSVISLERGKCLPSLPLAFGFRHVFGLPLEEIFDLNEEVNKMTQDLSPFSPMREVSSLHDAIDKLFDENISKGGTSIFPVINVYEKETEVVVEAEVPGISEEDLTIEAGDDTITLSGARKSEKEVQEENYFRKETNFGSFSRTINLPSSINKEKAEAELKNGILTVTIPKQKKIKPKVTKIKVKKS